MRGAASAGKSQAQGPLVATVHNLYPVSGFAMCASAVLLLEGKCGHGLHAAISDIFT
jgi:hypothetical protein